MAAIDFNTIIEKANPYHDERGRFTTASGGGAAISPAKAIAEYQNYAYQSINEGLRAGKVEGDVKDLVSAMDKGFEEATPTKWSQTVHRADGAATTAEIWEKNGTTAKLPKKGDLADLWMDGEIRQTIKDSLVGETFTDKGYMSTSKDRMKAQEFSTGNSYSPYGVDAMVHINVPKGSKVLDLGEDGFISGSGEQETILNRGSSYKIKAIEFNWETQGLDIYADLVTEVQKALSFEEILKFNPYHDSLGRFASANGATSMTYAPGKSKAHDLAIARIKAKEMVNRLSEEDKDEIRSLLNGGGSTSAKDSQESQAAGRAKEESKQKYSREEQVEAIEDWTLSDYQEIRAAQCGNAKGSAEYQEKLKKKGEAIEEYISSNPSYEGEIYRGIYMDNPATPKVGQKLDMQGTSSWSADEYVAQHFAGAAERKTFSEHAYVFKMQKAPAQSADIDDISRNHGELEVLVSKNVQFRVTGVEKTNTHTVITVEEA